MLVENIPDLFIPEAETSPELLVHDFRMTTDNVKSKVNLQMHMFSFLQIGKKQVHFAETSVTVSADLCKTCIEVSTAPPVVEVTSPNAVGAPLFEVSSTVFVISTV